MFEKKGEIASYSPVEIEVTVVDIDEDKGLAILLQGLLITSWSQRPTKIACKCRIG